MRTNTFPPWFRSAGLVVALAFLVVLIGREASAQTAISLAFFDENVVVQSNGPIRVDYAYNIDLNPPETPLSCTPESESLFQPGATRVDCSAGEDEQTINGSFYVLVTNGDATDVAIDNVAATPFQVAPSGFVAYNVEVVNSANATAREVIVSATLPPELIYLSSNYPNCRTSELPLITCTIFSLNADVPQGFQIRAQVKPGYIGSFQYQWNIALGDDQADLREDNNRFTVNTVVAVAQAPNQLFLPLLSE